MDALVYEPPSIVTILVLGSYLLFLSVSYHAFEKLFFAGILGPLVLGAIYARPLADILPADVQSAVLAIGYLGLILLIVQGGLDARMDVLSNPRNLLISLLVGITGVILPIGISMALLPLGFGYGFLESFAIGAALASTSLGTTFAVLGSFNGSASSSDPSTNSTNSDDTESGIANTRIGTILIGAALLDDIVGLVIIGVISALGSSGPLDQQGGTQIIKPWTIAGPIVSSFLLLVLSWLLSRFALNPLSRQFARQASLLLSDQALAPDDQPVSPHSRMRRRLTRCVVHLRSQELLATSLLVSTVLAYSVISEEIGSSLLIGAFCSGAMMKYVHVTFSREFSTASATSGGPSMWSPDRILSSKTPLGVIQDTILVPFFFSSIGSAIPVKSMFQGTTVWRGVILAGLMALAKVCAGGWVSLADLLEQRCQNDAAKKSRGQATEEQMEESTQAGNAAAQVNPTIEMQLRMSPARDPIRNHIIVHQTHTVPAAASTHHEVAQAPSKAPAWPAALFLGTALMSRGEIGFLVINVANQGGLLNEQAFNVAIWAIVLNTLAGPISVGILLRSQPGQSILQRRADLQKGRWA